jgi:hypothetical protein
MPLLIFKGVHPAVFDNTSLFFSTSTQHQKLAYILCIMSLLVSMALLHVSAYEAIIRQYTLTYSHKLLIVFYMNIYVTI